VVDYDTTIHPGREGKITQQVKLKGYKGKVRKGVTITSNATNEPNLRLYVSVNVQPLVGVDPSYVRLTRAAHSDTPMELLLTSQKDDLKVSGVIFKVANHGGGGPQQSWQSDLPIAIDYTFTPDGKDGDGFYRYKVAVRFPVTEQAVQHGSFIISTNHPQKNEVDVRGMIDGR
jgi:hypothetical protein